MKWYKIVAAAFLTTWLSLLSYLIFINNVRFVKEPNTIEDVVSGVVIAGILMFIAFLILAYEEDDA